MQRPFLMLALLAGACRAPHDAPPVPEPSWSEWSRALLAHRAPGKLTPVPFSGWTHDYGNTWYRDNAQISDYDGDGRIDYLRVVDPPDSYMHHIWVDTDHDGYFDDRIPTAKAPDPDQRVPEFELARRARATGD